MNSLTMTPPAYARRAPAPLLLRCIRVAAQTAALVFAGALLAMTLPAFAGFHTVIVMSGSMGSALRVGSVAVTQPIDAADVHEGDIVAFSVSERTAPVLHRVVAITVDEDGHRIATTRGDANDAPDQHPLFLDRDGERVVYSVPWIGYLLVFVQSGTGRVLLLISIVSLCLLRLLQRRRNNKNNAPPAI